MTEEALISALGNFRFERELKVAPKNTHKIYFDGEKRVFVKIYDRDDFYEREILFHEVFKKHVRVPEIYLVHNKTVVMEYIEARPDRKIKAALKDWIRVHEYYLDKDRRSNYPCLSYGRGNIFKFLEEESHRYDGRAKAIAKILRKDKIKRIRTLVHGDLCKRNILTDNKGNCYLDFEFSGQGHPAFDVATLAFSYPKHYEWIIRYYAENSSFSYEGIVLDIKRYIVKRGAVSIRYLNENKNMNVEQKERARQYCLEMIDKSLCCSD